MFSVLYGRMGKSQNVQRKRGHCLLPHDLEEHESCQDLVHREEWRSVAAGIIPAP